MAIADEVLQRQDKDGMLRRALERIIQLYTDKSHFVYELLQNAEDAGASRIKFEQYSDRLIVLHDGRAFSVENLQGLCDIGKSDKVNNLNQIGEFGVGFKSVFGICERVRLYSHPSEADKRNGLKRFAVEIIDFTHPVDIEDQEIEAGYTTKFEFPYSVGHTFSGFTSLGKLNTVLSERLQHLGITTLLFMKNLQAIDYEITLPNVRTGGSYTLDKQIINDHCALVSAAGETLNKKQTKKKRKKNDKSESVSYLVFSRPVEGIHLGRTIDIAFTVSIDEEGKYTFSPTQHPYISVYFPTETESKLNFIVQGPFRTTPNRSSVPVYDNDNMLLARQASSLMTDILRELRDKKQLDYSLLNILPVSRYGSYNTSLFGGMHSAIRSMLQSEALLLSEDGIYTRSKNAKIARGEKLTKVLDSRLLTELIDDGTTYHWLPKYLTESNRTYRELYDFLTDELRIEVVRPENLHTYFNDNRKFLYNREDTWLVELYKMYSVNRAAFSMQRRGTHMLTAVFVKTSVGTFVAPYRESNDTKKEEESVYSWGYEIEDKNTIYLPNVFLPIEESEESEYIPVVDPKIFKECPEFFTDTLKLQQPNEYAFFIRNFRKRYGNGETFSDDQHIHDAKLLLRYYSKEKYRREVVELIQKFFPIKCRKAEDSVYVFPQQETALFSVTDDNMSIKEYYEHIAARPYADEKFYDEHGIDTEDLKILGVTDNIARGESLAEYQDSSWWMYGAFRPQLTLDKLDDALKYISDHPEAADSQIKSSFIFRFLQNNEDKLSRLIGYGEEIERKYSEIVTKLRQDETQGIYSRARWDGKWLYNENFELVSPGLITKRELNEHLYGKIHSESNLYDWLGFKKDRTDWLQEAQKEYEKLTEDKQEKYYASGLMKKHNLTEEELDAILCDYEKLCGKGKRPGISASSQKAQYEFPVSNVKNWDVLKKHVAEILCFASPVQYDYKVRRIRISKPADEVKAYLKSMYNIDGAYKYACQLCHEAFRQFEACQIVNNPEIEIDPLHLCCCPNCAAKYRQMRKDESSLEDFIITIMTMTNAQIETSNRVKVDFKQESIWFTQTHIAEIRELLVLQSAAKNYAKQAAKWTSAQKSEWNKGTQTGTDVYKEYVGRQVKHRDFGRGVVKSYNGENVEIEFTEGVKAGRKVSFKLEILLEKGLIQIVENTTE